MFSSILVPLDGSPVAEAALPYARSLAARTGATLTLVRAAKQSALFGNSDESQQQAIACAEDYVGQFATALSDQGLTIETGVPFGGDPARWIVEECDVHHADLIVMATHDRIGVNRWLHGSVAESVVHATKLPVMIVKASSPPELAQRFDVGQPVLVVPLDGSAFAESALPVATRLAGVTRARIVLMMVVPNQTNWLVTQTGMLVTSSEAEFAEMERDGRVYLESIATNVRMSGLEVQAIVRIGDPALEIASIGQQYAAAAIVMATRGRTGIVRSMLGSVAGAVLHGANVPVVVTHPSRQRGTEQPVGWSTPGRVSAVAV
jgi:nucleotide-binding universal stress UspA family protein